MGHVGIIVQARVSSTRFPGKVLKEVEGHPLLWWVLHRLGRCRTLETIVLATSERPENDALLPIAHEAGAQVFRGSEEDVLDRYYRAAHAHDLETIVRAPADSPFMDPEVTDLVVAKFAEGGYDYACNFLEGNAFPQGLQVEAFSHLALERAWREARLPSEREHVTPYIWKHPEIFRLAGVYAEADYSHLRWLVDHPEDIRFVRAVAARLAHRGADFSWREVVALLEREPGLLALQARAGDHRGYLRALAGDPFGAGR
ncbi:MAG: glycosyltransferase family protein [Chloroflexi bacterium]|nr:glycosyltransferase family protein [Chloroflexota bacterium]